MWEYKVFRSFMSTAEKCTQSIPSCADQLGYNTCRYCYQNKFSYLNIIMLKPHYVNG